MRNDLQVLEEFILGVVAWASDGPSRDRALVALGRLQGILESGYITKIDYGFTEIKGDEDA